MENTGCIKEMPEMVELAILMANSTEEERENILDFLDKILDAKKNGKKEIFVHLGTENGREENLDGIVVHNLDYIAPLRV